MQRPPVLGSFSACVLRAGAVYDVLATIPFATPWTARAALRAFAALPVGGGDLPGFEEGHLLFVVLFGTVVMMWSVHRLARPSRTALQLDTAGRAVFATWMTRALALGASHVVGIFLALELLFFALQLTAVFRWPSARKDEARA